MPDRSIRAPLGAQPDTRDGDRRSALDLFLEPRSIAVIGASDDPTRIGGRTLFNIRQGGFPGPVYPINPRRQTVPGQIGRAHVRTPVTNVHLVCRLMIEKKKT